MLLAIDIGNTNIVLGLYQGKKLITHWRLATQAERTADEYGVIISQLIDYSGHRCQQIIRHRGLVRRAADGDDDAGTWRKNFSKSIL